MGSKESGKGFQRMNWKEVIKKKEAKSLYDLEGRRGVQRRVKICSKLVNRKKANKCYKKSKKGLSTEWKWKKDGWNVEYLYSSVPKKNFKDTNAKKKVEPTWVMWVDG